MRSDDDANALLAALRQTTAPEVVEAIEALLRSAPDHELCRINPLAFATRRNLGAEAVIGGFLHAARLGIFELSWNVLCPGCGGVLGGGATLRTVDQSRYTCQLCAGGYEPTLDELVEVTFSVSPRMRKIPAHDPESLPLLDYCRQVFWGSGVDLPEDEALEKVLDEITLEGVELPAGQKAVLSLQLPEAFLILFDPVTHIAQFLDVKGEPTRERQTLPVVLAKGQPQTGTLQLRPGPLRILLENQTDQRCLPSVWVANDALHDLLGRRRPFLTAARLLSNQVFRDLYGTDLIDLQQKLKITSLTFLFTDLQSSTELYERVGDLVAYELVQAHFRLLQEIVAAEGGAVVKTIGDAVMASFITPDRAMAAALRMREAMRGLHDELVLKIGLHEGPCLAVVLNDRQDYFGQTVNIASRVQGLCQPRSIVTTAQVLGHGATAALLQARHLPALPRQEALRGISRKVEVFEIPQGTEAGAAATAPG